MDTGTWSGLRCCGTSVLPSRGDGMNTSDPSSHGKGNSFTGLQLSRYHCRQTRCDIKVYSDSYNI